MAPFRQEQAALEAGGSRIEHGMEAGAALLGLGGLGRGPGDFQPRLGRQRLDRLDEARSLRLPHEAAASLLTSEDRREST